MTQKIEETIERRFESVSIFPGNNLVSINAFINGFKNGLLEALEIVKNHEKTNCAGCGEYKYAPLFRPESNGYICLECINKSLDEYVNLVESVNGA